MEAQEITEAARWVRVLDFARVDAELGEFFAGERMRVVSEFKDGRAQAFDVSGPGYSGFLLLRFERRLIDGALQVHLITAKGRGMKNAQDDLLRIARKVGAVRVTVDIEDFAVMRMYQRAGWGIESARVGLGL